MAADDGLWRTTTFRLTALYGAIYALGIALLLGSVYAQTIAYLTARSDRAVRAEATLLERAGPEGILTALRREAGSDPLSRFAVYSATGEKVAGDARLRPADLPLDGLARSRRVAGGGPTRAMGERAPWGEILIVERDSRQIEEVRRIVLRALIWSGAVIVVLGLALGVTFSARPLARIRAMKAASEAITGGDFSRRLPVRRAAAGDELDELARIANAMMDEAERLMTEARTVGEAVAHELRSPLTRLRAALDHAGQAVGEGAPGRPLLEACVAEADGVLARFHALLRIAALERRERGAGVRPVDLSAIVAQAAELYEPLAAQRALRFEASATPGLVLEADGELIFEALANLIDNAVKFTPPGGSVRVAASRGADGIEIVVADDGPGIPAAERALVTRRFYRGARHEGIAGHGLGLSLVAAVADLHGLSLAFEDGRPGTVARLTKMAAAPPLTRGR